MRMSYQRQKEVLEMPNLIEVQKDSYQWFLDEGLKEVFDDISPIADYGGKLSLEFIDFTYDEKDAKYSIEQCKERDVTYAAPLKVRVRLINKETEEINEHEIFMGDLPLMTATGTFVINGAERVIVSQLVRSPGIYYAIAHDKLGKRLFSSTVIPNRGAWLEYETDSNDVFYVRVDRTRKVPITVLIRALGIGTNAEIIDLFGEEPKILASFTKDTSTNYQEGLLELYKKIRPGEPLAVESAESLIMAMFFDPRRYLGHTFCTAAPHNTHKRACGQKDQKHGDDIFISYSFCHKLQLSVKADRSVLNTCHQDRRQKSHNDRYIIKSHRDLHHILKQNPQSQIQDQKNTDRQQCNHISFFLHFLHKTIPFITYYFPGFFLRVICFLSYHISPFLSCC